MTNTTHTSLRRRLSLITVAAVTATSLAFTGVASADPAFSEAGGRCVSNPVQTRTASGAIKGAVNITCDRNMSLITVKVSLWRWNGSAWYTQTASAWSPVYNVARYSLQTPVGICGGGSAWWFTRAAIHIVRPDGSVYDTTRDSSVVNLTPSAC